MAADRSLALLAIGLVFGGGVGFVLAAGYGVTLDGHDHGDHGAHGTATAGAHAGHGGHDTPLSLPPGPDAPTLAMTLTPDPASGWNLHVETTAFRFAPEHASGTHVPGEGHAHVYINGGKYARLYGPWLHIPTLPPGPVTVEVTLNANDHRPLAIADAALAARVEIPRR